MFMVEVMSVAKRLQATDSVYYNYYFNQESATNNEKTDDIIQTSYKCIELKQLYQMFAFKMDDLVLYFVEKLLLKHCYGEACRIMSLLAPCHYIQRPWPSVCMTYVSRYNIGFGVFLGSLLYPIYCVIMKFVFIIKQKINKGRFY